ncbi:hypothetical protein QUF90_02760 [Desulfococcaceae bacterium HSG9]|nr:hypothetical protein [Desulfococcaceae bacterium HSG9]
MKRKNLIEIVCIIDKSGSMNSIKSDAIGGFNAFLEEQKDFQENALLTFVLFNDEYFLIHNGVNLKDVQPLSNQTFKPSGMTALLDAVGKTIATIKGRHAEMNTEKRPGKVLMAILTDGEENASEEYSRQQIFDMIELQKEEGWEFLFLAANQDAIKAAESIAIPSDRTIDFEATDDGIQDAFVQMDETMVMDSSSYWDMVTKTNPDNDDT